MSPESLKYWPWDVLPVERQSEFHRTLIELFESVQTAGRPAYANDGETLLGFGSPDHRRAEFVLRSSRNRYWEPWLTDAGRAIPLGPYFGLSETACVVLDGIHAVSQFTMRWLSGATVAEATDGLPVYDRHDTRTVLKLVGYTDQA